MGAVLFYGFIAAIVVTHAQRWRWRLLAPPLALLLIVSIGFSRVYLGAHYLSDVAAAAAAGLAWLALCLTAVEIVRRPLAGRFGLIRQQPAVEAKRMRGP